MVNSDALFCRLAGINTLLAFDGIILSAADFQLRLTSLIEQFNKALLAEDQTVAQSEALCRMLCQFLDKRLTGDAQNSALSWQRYSLVHYFYGYGESEEHGTIGAQIGALLDTDSDVIFRYAWQLLLLLIQQEGQTEALMALRTAHLARYFSRIRPPEHTFSEEPLTWIAPPGDTGVPRLMVFITGPFAGKWFSQSDLSSGDDRSIVWVVAENAATLASRLVHLKNNHHSVATLAFFPLLADGFDNSGIMIEQIAAWQCTFSSTRLPERLPCLLGLYTRLSQQRYPEDPDKAIWSGGLTATPDYHLTLESRLVNLIARDCGNDLYAIQRRALSSMFVAWLAEKRIMNVLQNMFDSTPLALAGVTLADHGQGFTRHGAWSHWLDEKYGILPGLSASIALPPLPDIHLSPRAEPPPKQRIAQDPLPAITPPSPRKNRLNIAALLATLLCLIGFFYSDGKHHIDAWLNQRLPLKMRQQEQPAATLFTLSDATPLFENGSSNLMPESTKILAELVPVLTRAPQQHYLIIGHSDNTGSADVNMALSTERARVIRDWLTERTGLPASHFIVEGAGNSRPAATNDTREGRAQNRRVEIIPLSVQRN